MNVVNNIINTRIIKLWENPNPSATFAAQDVNLSSNNYDVLLIHYKSYYEQSFMMSCIIEKGKSVWLDGVQTTTTSQVLIKTRQLDYVSDVKYNAKDCNSQSSGASRTTNNGYLVPVTIYGIKF